MLEISKLTKIYKNKKGKDVHALSEVSLKFPETGMVFLLGKSGSGKSTLLNVCGGLDNPTSGEIIIKGKSSKDFTQSDFDSYRNTYVGFIFQEYNILNEFSVYDNIALAIELQNKKVNHEDIVKLLKDVDLVGYEKRKPNTLSGGQKQRIAIARALIKNPEIIMADEPTGALDSNTGKQVLDTLKKLSKDRLVIVVSHDREFAETYADRIIELKDGKVISDNSRVRKECVSFGKSLSLVGDTLCINDGKNLSDSEFDKIKEFIKSDDKLILSKDKSGIVSFKKFAKINDFGEQEVFESTDEKNLKFKEYDQKKNIFIKSKLPMKHAIKMGLSGLRTKPFRLFFTILLCSVSFLLFGLLSTMTFYDSENIFKDTLKNSELDYMRIGKQYLTKEISYYGDGDFFEYEGYIPTSFFEKDYKELKNKYGKNLFYGLESYTTFSTQKTKNIYYSNYFMNYSYMDEDNDLYNKIVGSYPKNDNEILLSSYIVDSMIYYNVYDSKNVSLNLTKREDVLNKEIMFNNRKYKVVGYFDSGVVPSKYDLLKENDESAMLTSDFFNYLNDSLHFNVFVTKNELVNLSYSSDVNSYYNPSIADYSSVVYKDNKTEKFTEYSNGSYINKGNLSLDKMYGKDLNDTSIYVSPYVLADLVINKYGILLGENNKYEKLYSKAIDVQAGGKYVNDSFVKYNREELIKNAKDLFDMINEDLFVDVQLFSQDDNIAYGDIYKYKVVGIYLEYFDRGILIFEDEVFNKLWNIQKERLSYYSLSETNYVSEVTPYQTIYVPFNNSSEFINEMWNIYGEMEYGKDGSKYTVNGSFVETLSFLDDLVDTLFVVFLYGGIFLCIFALLLLSNFISLSISNKTKEIGILRAVGARSIDVFKIFFSESFTISLICFVISIVLCVSVCNVLNSVLASGIGISVFVFGVLSFIVIAVVSFVTTVIATYLPVRKAAKRKPVESIRSL